MEFKNLKPGFSDDLVSFKVVSKSQIHEKLLRLTVADSSNEHGNVIIQSDPLIKKFECILPETNIAMSQFLITDAYADISQYFPDFIHGYDIATFNTNYDWFILINLENLPNMQISYRYNLISINTNTDLLNLSLENLYKSQSKIEEKSLFRAGNIFNLKIVRENSLEDHLSSGCYGLILETACSYKTNHSKDYTFEFKITDPSIYPQIARIVVFHKCLQEIPKVARFGDIVIFDKILFKTEDGVLNGRSATGSKFSLFSIEKNHINPYSVFNGNLKPSPNHKEILTYLRDWSKTNLASYISSHRPLNSIINTEICDILLRIYGVFKLGVTKVSPTVILGYDNHKIVQIVVPNNIEILYRYIQPNQTAIFKHIKHENGRFSLTDRTEILILPDFIDGISSLIDKEDDCQSIAVIYRPVCTTKKRSIVLPSMQVFPTYKFTHLKALNFNSKFRLEGMIIKISPDEPKANYCLNCSTAEKTQICVCGSETCVKTKIELVLWDPVINCTVNVFVSEENSLQFTNYSSWPQFKSLVLSFDACFEFGIKKCLSGFEIIDTNLIT